MKRNTRRLSSGLRAMARRTADLDVAAVGIAGALVVDVRAVDGEAGDHLAQGLAQGVEGEVARPPDLLRQPVELVGQHVQLAGERDLHDQQLLAIDHLGEARIVLDPVVIQPGEGRGVGRVDEQAVDLVQEFVAAGPVDRPGLDQRLVGRRGSSRRRRTAAGRAGLPGSVARPRRCARAAGLPRRFQSSVLRSRARASKAWRAQARSVVLLEPAEVLRRVVEPVGVVDAQAVDLALGQPAAGPGHGRPRRRPRAPCSGRPGR